MAFTRSRVRSPSAPPNPATTAYPLNGGFVYFLSILGGNALNLREPVWNMRVPPEPDVGTVGAAAEVLGVLFHRSDELHGKPAAHRLELDRGLGLNATSGYRASFPEAFCFGWLAREGASAMPRRRRKCSSLPGVTCDYGRSAPRRARGSLPTSGRE